MKSTIRRGLAMVAIAAAVGLSGTVAHAATPAHHDPATYPKTITLPNDGFPGGLGFQPEGIEIVGTTAYVSSVTDGRIVTVDLRSGTVQPLVAPAGGPALGIHLTDHLLLVAGQVSGEVRVYDRSTGEQLQIHPIPGAELVNDITVVGTTAYATDSRRAVVYAFPVTPDGLGAPREIPLTGDFRLVRQSEFGAAFNGNGITALDENTLLMAQTDSPDDPFGTLSAIYRVDARTGHTERLAIEGGQVHGADGIELRGSTLSVAQHSENTVAQLELENDGRSATYERTLRDADLAVPTNLAFGPGGAPYTVNSRFDQPSSADLAYEVVRIRG